MENRDKLGRKTRHIDIPIEEVYRLLDAGMTVSEVAEQLGVSRDTIYRRHREYQKKKSSAPEGLPKLPDDAGIGKIW